MYDEDDDATNIQYYNDEASNNDFFDDCITYTSFMVIRTKLFNFLKGNTQFTKYVIELILEVKEIITS